MDEAAIVELNNHVFEDILGDKLASISIFFFGFSFFKENLTCKTNRVGKWNTAPPSGNVPMILRMNGISQ